VRCAHVRRAAATSELSLQHSRRTPEHFRASATCWPQPLFSHHPSAPTVLCFCLVALDERQAMRRWLVVVVLAVAVLAALVAAGPATGLQAGQAHGEASHPAAQNSGGRARRGCSCRSAEGAAACPKVTKACVTGLAPMSPGTMPAVPPNHANLGGVCVLPCAGITHTVPCCAAAAVCSCRAMCCTSTPHQQATRVLRCTLPQPAACLRPASCPPPPSAAAGAATASAGRSPGSTCGRCNCCRPATGRCAAVRT
jgi:hypothetical protein